MWCLLGQSRCWRCFLKPQPQNYLSLRLGLKDFAHQKFLFTLLWKESPNKWSLSSHLELYWAEVAVVYPTAASNENICLGCLWVGHVWYHLVKNSSPQYYNRTVFGPPIIDLGLSKMTIDAKAFKIRTQPSRNDVCTYSGKHSGRRLIFVFPIVEASWLSAARTPHSNKFCTR